MDDTPGKNLDDASSRDKGGRVRNGILILVLAVAVVFIVSGEKKCGTGGGCGSYFVVAPDAQPANHIPASAK